MRTSLSGSSSDRLRREIASRLADPGSVEETWRELAARFGISLDAMHQRVSRVRREMKQQKEAR